MRAISHALACWLCVACQDATVYVGEFDRPDASMTVGTLENVLVEPGTRAEFCRGRGPAIHDSAIVADCDASIMQRLFSYALCACGTLENLDERFMLDSYDSRQGRYAEGQGQDGAAVGVNGSFTRAAPDTQLMGSLLLGDTGELALTGSRFSVFGDLKTQGSLRASGPGTRIERDLWLAGDVLSPTGAIEVGRDAYQAAGHQGIDKLRVAGTTHANARVDLLPPCACEPDALLDIAAIVAQARVINDNAEVGWSADEPSTAAWASEAKELPCGRLYVDAWSITGPSTISLSASGRTALFVDGDITSTSLVTLDLHTMGSAGELDIFVSGDIKLALGSTLLLWDVLGQTSRPAALRIFVAGSIQLGGALQLEGQLYAPRATIDALPGSGHDVHGSIFARDIRSLGATQMHYDEAIRHIEPECTAAAPQRCSTCYQCPRTLACIDGECQPCRIDADCCAPMTCSEGSCQLQHSAR